MFFRSIKQLKHLIFKALTAHEQISCGNFGIFSLNLKITGMYLRYVRILLPPREVFFRVFHRSGSANLMLLYVSRVVEMMFWVASGYDSP